MASPQARFTHRFGAMGTGFSIDIRTPAPRAVLRGAAEAAETLLHWADRTFSTYDPGSEVCRFDRGDLGAQECCGELRMVVALCHSLNESTSGYFDAWATGHFDPSGVVKGWAIEQASEILLSHGLADHIVEGGGDIRLQGSPATGPGTGSKWTVGTRHPLRPGAYAAALSLGPCGVATSGTYERGQHVVNPLTGKPAGEVASVTVVGPDLTMADAYATAAFAMGAAGPSWLAQLDGFESLVIGLDGRGWSSAGWGRLALGGSQ